MISAAWVSRERASQAEERASAKAPRQEGPTGGGRKEGQERESERGGGEFCGGEGWQVTARSWLWRLDQVMSPCPQGT